MTTEIMNLNPNINPVVPNVKSPGLGMGNAAGVKNGFSDAVAAMCQYASKVDGLQQASDTSIQQLLTGENSDITSVVAAVAKADASFKVLVGVRNKLIEAYKQTMNMPL